MSRTLVLLTALVALTGALLTPAPPASARPVITVAPVINAAYPQQVPQTASGLTTRISFTVNSSEPVPGDATVLAWSDDGGLVIRNPHQSVGNLAQPATVSFDVAGAALGVHELFVDVSGPSAIGRGTVLRYVWTNGSPLQAATNKLYKRSYTWEGTTQVAGLESSTRAVQMLHIVSPTFAYVGLPAFGRPSCTGEGNGCLPYAFDNRTGLLQVGTQIIAAVHRESLYSDGLVPAETQDGEPYGRYDFPAQDFFVEGHYELTGTFRYSSSDYPSGLTYEKVTFDPDGSYRLAYAYDGGKVKRLEGRFKIDNRGAVTFRSLRGKVVQRGTVMAVGRTLPCAIHGTCRVGQRGIWLILSGRKGRHPDGNLLRMVR